MTLPWIAAGLRLNNRADKHGNAAVSHGDALSDEALVEAIVRRGSQGHFRLLLTRYKVRVHQIALSVLGPSQSAQAEDVAQEVFISIFSRLDQFRGDCRFSTWLYRLAINAAIDFRRANARHHGASLDDATLAGAQGGLPDEQDDPRRRALIQEAMRELPESQRMMVHLFYWLDLKVREIAEVMDCPEGTVKVYLQRARNSLAASLGGIRND